MRQKLPKPVLLRIAQAVRDHRERHDLSQFRLSQAFQIHPGNVSAWELGKTAPDLTSLISRMGRLGQPVPYWLVEAIHAAGAEWPDDTGDGKRIRRGSKSFARSLSLTRYQQLAPAG